MLSLREKMRLSKECSILIISGLCIIAARSYKVDTKSKQSSNKGVTFEDDEHVAADVIKVQEHFNPGHPQHGGWRKPENPVQLESSVSDNQWHAGDLSGYSSGQDASQLSRLSEGSYEYSKLGQNVNFPGSDGQSDIAKYSTYTGGSLGHGDDLIVGQGSVQRPANLGVSNQYHSGGFGQGVGAFPVQAHISPGASQYSQVISSGSKKPSYSVSEQPEYLGQHSGGGNSYRPLPIKPAQVHSPQKVSYGGQAAQHDVNSAYPSFQQSSLGHSGSQFSSHPAASRPAASHQSGQLGPKPGSVYKPKPIDGHHPSGGHRFPPGPFPNSGLRGGPKLPPPGVKYPPPGAKFPPGHPQLPIRRFPLPLGPPGPGQKYFHQ